MSRFIVTELEGWAREIPSTGPPGLSCHVIDTVIDTAYNYRLVATFRSEQGFSRREDREQRRTRARQRAAELCARLNAETP